MKWIVLPALWAAALIVALAVIWRLWRGRNIVLRDRFSPKFVRMVVVVLVLFGAGMDSQAAELPRRGVANDDSRSRVNTPPRNETIPNILDERTVVAWRYFSNPLSSWAETKRSLIVLENLSGKPDARVQKRLDDAVRHLPKKFRAIVAAEVEAAKVGRPRPTVTAEKIGEALAQLESGGCFDNWAMAYLWRKTAQLPQTRGDNARDSEKVAKLFAAFGRHARLANTMIRAEAWVKPPVFRPWRSKAAPPPSYRQRESEIQASLLKAAVRIYPSTNIDTWQSEATVVFAIDKDSTPATLIRAGKRQPLTPGKTVRLGRLDLIETPSGKAPVVLEHDWLGSVELPPGCTLTVWDLPKLLPTEALDKSKRASAAALKDDEQAVQRLERTLPLCHPTIRAALIQSPKATGAPRLRTILTLFDDSLVR
jgi:hypothetical protein